ncbi:heat stress transcription factor A-8 [Salvia miltiorrhiza]|uniref:heat stress transcription factor A-8 n=1 Tax=Salvia miltiorrhiza TaxID=226208 RepID=UPI0025AC454A|nr:heat stress transcription factor A-8 [Salvia miltiorrhiza]
MVKSVENGTTLPPFLVKCYEMVNDESTDELISWSDSNDSFIIWDESKFSSHLLPKYFKHSNFSSFVRQLNIYGFRKIDTDNWQFANEAFIKGQKHLLKNIIRRKNSHNLVQKKDAEPALQSEEEDKRLALWKEVESLKTDRNALTQELTNVRQHQQTSRSKMLLLAEQLKGMEKNQQQMLSFIVMAMQSPEIMAQFFQPKENSWRVAETGKTKLSEVIDDCEPTPSDGTIVRYQPPKDGAAKPACTAEAAFNYEDFMELDFSSDEMRDLLMDVDLLLGPNPVDEKLLSFENQGQFVLPDAPENDAVLEQLLLPYPSTQNEVPGEACTHSGMACQPDESENSDASADDVNEDQNQMAEATKFQSSEKVEVLTRQMGSLTSEMS